MDAVRDLIKLTLFMEHKAQDIDVYHHLVGRVRTVQIVPGIEA